MARRLDDYVFATGWGDPVHPDTVSSLVIDLIRVHNRSVPAEEPAASAAVPPVCMICGMFMPPRRCWLACRCMWWRPGWGTLTRE